MTDRPVVLVTGASKGIGAATALLFAERGFDVCVNYRSDADGARKTVDACEAAGARAQGFAADVADPDAVAQMFAAMDAAFDPVHCVVNNAGIIGGASKFTDLSPKALRQTFATNLDGTVFTMQEAARRMRTDQGGAGGVIVNLSSIAAVLGSPGEYVHYAASKGAVETLSIGAAKELGPLGIRVTAIRVGTTATDIHEREGNPDRPAKIAALTPLGRIAQPEDIARAAHWLATSDAAFVSGTILTVAGGFLP